MIPVNKQAALFLSRKRRVETVTEALQIFADKVLSPDVTESIVEMLANEDSPALKITITIRRDPATPNNLTVKLQTGLMKELSQSHYLGLLPK